MPDPLLVLKANCGIYARGAQPNPPSPPSLRGKGGVGIGALTLGAPAAVHLIAGAARARAGERPRGRNPAQGDGSMATIDSDAHVVESERTWEYMDPAD